MLSLSLSLLLRFPLRCTGSFLRRVRNNLIWNTAGTERPWMFFTWHHYKDIIKSSQRACCARLGLRGRGWSRVGIGCQSRIIKVYPWIRSWILSSVTESKSLCICSFFHARRPQLHPTPPPHPDSERSLKGRGGGILFAARSDRRCEYQSALDAPLMHLPFTHHLFPDSMCLHALTLRSVGFRIILFRVVHSAWPSLFCRHASQDPNYFWLMFRYTAPVVIARFPCGIQRRFRSLSRADIWRRGSLLRGAGNRHQRHQ